jgi:hypothetical protein
MYKVLFLIAAFGAVLSHALPMPMQMMAARGDFRGKGISHLQKLKRQFIDKTAAAVVHIGYWTNSMHTLLVMRAATDLILAGYYDHNFRGSSASYELP